MMIDAIYLCGFVSISLNLQHVSRAYLVPNQALFYYLLRSVLRRKEDTPPVRSMWHQRTKTLEHALQRKVSHTMPTYRDSVFDNQMTRKSKISCKWGSNAILYIQHILTENEKLAPVDNDVPTTLPLSFIPSKKLLTINKLTPIIHRKHTTLVPCDTYGHIHSMSLVSCW